MTNIEDKAETTPATKPQPVKTSYRVMTTLIAVGTALSVSGLITDTEWAAYIGGAVNLVSLGWSVWNSTANGVSSQTVPYADVRSYVNERRDIVAGPAADIATGTPVTDRLVELPPNLDGSGPVDGITDLPDEDTPVDVEPVGRTDPAPPPPDVPGPRA